MSYKIITICDKCHKEFNSEKSGFYTKMVLENIIRYDFIHNDTHLTLKYDLCLKCSDELVTILRNNDYLK